MKSVGMDGSEIFEVKAKLDSVHNPLMVEQTEEKDLNYINRTGLKATIRSLFGAILVSPR